MDILKILNKFRRLKVKKYEFNKKLSDLNKELNLIALLRVRNESLILDDTLDYLSSFVDAIIAYDDASTDNTFEILKKCSKCIAIIRNFKWEENVSGRIMSETIQRGELLTLAQKYSPKWILCADADERIIGNVSAFISSEESHEIDAVRISLFDAYMTKDNCQSYQKGVSLINFRKYFGPERRDILMLWKNAPDVFFEGAECREPKFFKDKKIVTNFYCQHYGKAVSIEHWEETCDYYYKYFPYNSYGKKWVERMGKAIHDKSDFGRILYFWGDDLFYNSVVIHPVPEEIIKNN